MQQYCSDSRFAVHPALVSTICWLRLPFPECQISDTLLFNIVGFVCWHSNCIVPFFSPKSIECRAIQLWNIIFLNVDLLGTFCFVYFSRKFNSRFCNLPKGILAETKAVYKPSWNWCMNHAGLLLESAGLFSKTQMYFWVAMNTALVLVWFFLCFSVARCCCTWNLVDEFTFILQYWQNNTLQSVCNLWNQAHMIWECYQYSCSLLACFNTQYRYRRTTNEPQMNRV